MKRVLVTGATGFVGRSLCERLAQSGWVVRAALRKDCPLPPAIAEKTIAGDIGAKTEWKQALHGVTSVIHVAGRAHILNDSAANADAYFETNERGTGRLAEAAAEAGVRRFIFVSTIKVNGEEIAGRAYTADDEPKPVDAYGLSKWRGEQRLREIAPRSGMEVAIARPPLVYGPGVRANFLRLLTWVDQGWPLPLGAIRNRRSLVSVTNLCDLLATLLDRQGAVAGVWMVSDGEDLSTPELIRRMGSAMNRPSRLLPVPASLLRLAGAMTGRSAEVARLCGDLRVDVTRTRKELGWVPPLTVEAGLALTVDWYLRSARA